MISQIFNATTHLLENKEISSNVFSDISTSNKETVKSIQILSKVSGDQFEIVESLDEATLQLDNITSDD